ncbi:hypothetical protein ABZ897_12885 [Nonomuraea sp. NPDC046802]
MGKHEDPNSPKAKPFVPDEPTPDGHKKPQGQHAEDDDKGSK